MAAKKRTFTAADQSELAALLQSAMTAGESPAPAVLAEAVKVAKPAKATKPKRPPADPLATRIKRLATNVRNLSTKIEGARREIWEARDQLAKAGNRFGSIPLHLLSAEVNLPSWQRELTGLAGYLAELVAAYFADLGNRSAHSSAPP